MSKSLIMADAFVYFLLKPWECTKLTRKCIAFLPSIKRRYLLEKCESRFLNEMDVNTLIKRTR